MRRMSFEYKTLVLLIVLSPLFQGCSSKSTNQENQGVDAKAQGDAALALNGCVVSSELKSGTAQHSTAIQTHNQAARGFYATAIDRFAKAKAIELRNGKADRVARIDGYLREIENKLRGCDSVMMDRTGSPPPIARGMSYTDTAAAAPGPRAVAVEMAASTPGPGAVADATADPMSDLRNRP